MPKPLARLSLSVNMLWDNTLATHDLTLKRMRRSLRTWAARTYVRARQSIRKRKRVSEPGKPPSSHTGLLKRALRFAEQNQTMYVVGVLVASSRSSGAPAALEFGGTTTIHFKRYEGRGRSRRKKTVKVRRRIEARPILIPAMTAAVASLVSKIKEQSSRDDFGPQHHKDLRVGSRGGIYYTVPGSARKRYLTASQRASLGNDVLASIPRG